MTQLEKINQKVRQIFDKYPPKTWTNSIKTGEFENENRKFVISCSDAYGTTSLQIRKLDSPYAINVEDALLVKEFIAGQQDRKKEETEIGINSFLNASI